MSCSHLHHDHSVPPSHAPHLSLFHSLTYSFSFSLSLIYLHFLFSHTLTVSLFYSFSFNHFFSLFYCVSLPLIFSPFFILSPPNFDAFSHSHLSTLIPSFFYSFNPQFCSHFLFHSFFNFLLFHSSPLLVPWPRFLFFTLSLHPHILSLTLFHSITASLSHLHSFTPLLSPSHPPGLLSLFLTLSLPYPHLFTPLVLLSLFHSMFSLPHI